jgi:hypothetical protein
VEGVDAPFYEFSKRIPTLLGRNIRAYFEATWKKAKAKGAMSKERRYENHALLSDMGVKFVAPDFKPIERIPKAEQRASAQGLAEVSAMSGSLARPGASNAANPGAGDGSAAPLRLPQDVVQIGRASCRERV